MGDTPLSSMARDADISQSGYAVQTRQLFDVIDQIRDIGGQLNLELPRIVVIGNQSAGKSSLIEAIARINVPRGNSTTTRCPTEVRLRSSQELWQCSISLRYDYTEDGYEMVDPVLVAFGDAITDRSKVDIMLRRAQLAILNDAHDVREYLDLDATQISEVDIHKQFSKNVVCIEVSGPQLTDLTFVDLPGIIQHHPTDLGLVDLIKSMVRDYINDPAALILCTITMKDDPENQAALSAAKTADPEGKRTIGVLTKPDTVQASDAADWVTVLKNEGRHRLNLGYYITKQPAQAEVQARIGFEDARQRETNFFDSSHVWRSLPASVRQNVGTPRLTTALSVLLSTHIRKSLPGIFDKIHESLRQVESGLSVLGNGPSTNPIADTIGLCDRFTSALNRYVLGGEDYEQLVQGNKRAFETFKIAIRGTAPVFLPYTAAEATWNNAYSEPADILEDRGKLDTSTRYDLDKVRKSIKDATTRELPFNVPYAVKVRMMLLPIKHWNELVCKCFDTVQPRVSSIVDSIVQEIFGRFDQTSLLSRVQDIVKRELSLRQTETQAALKLLFDMETRGPFTQNLHYFTATREKLKAHYRDVRRRRIQTRPEPAAPSPVQAVSPSVAASYPLPLEEQRHEYARSIAPSARTQWGRPESCSPPRSYYRRSAMAPTPREASPAAEPAEPTRAELLNQVISKLALLGFSGVTESDLPKLVKEDEWEEEITVMAETRAYFQVAYKRIIDTIPQAIDHVFVRPLAETMQQALISGLQFDSPDAHERCKAYLAESPDKAAYRQRLNADKERLERAREALRAIGFGQ